MTDVTPRFKAPAKEPKRRAHNSTLPAPTSFMKGSKKPSRPPAHPEYWANRIARRHLADGRCEADGLHHPDCPGRDWGEEMALGAFVAHHVNPVSPDQRDDSTDNLRWIWNGLTPFGKGGCHQMIHDYSPKAKELGLLT